MKFLRDEMCTMPHSSGSVCKFITCSSLIRLDQNWTLCIAKLQFSMLQFNALRLVVHTQYAQNYGIYLGRLGSTGLERNVLDILCYLYTTMMFTMNNVANLENQMESRFCDVHFVRLEMDDDKSDLILTLLVQSQGWTQSVIQIHSLLNCNVENLKYLKERMQTA